MADVHTVVESYADYLFKKQRRAWAAFQRRRRNAPESALAEAMVFRVLQHCEVKPKVADLVSAGGPDFCCADELPSRFMVEATSFLPDKVTRDTALRNEMPEQMTGQAFGRLTPQIDTKATEKLRQFANLTMPGVLAIASSTTVL